MSSRIFLVILCMLVSRASANVIADNCRNMTFVSQIIGKALKGHELESFETSSCELCQIKCYINEMCVSYNCGKNTCDLNSSDHVLHPGDLKEDKGKIYRASENACQNHQCRSNATCLNGFTDKGYKCKCHPGFTGNYCEKAIVHGGWSSWGNWSLCSAQCKGQGTKTRYRNCTNPTPENGGDPCHGSNVSTIQCTSLPCSCKELLEVDPSASSMNKAYMLSTDKGIIPVYCHMSQIPGCDGAGWTLVMKIDGSKPSFRYHSAYWISKISYNEQGGLTGLDEEETKLPTYWSTPFSKICLGMKVGVETNFLMIEKSAPSLHSLIADGSFKATSLGRNSWKSLITGSSLQRNCNMEGFNAASSDASAARARIGFVGNNEENCVTSDSRIGFGSEGNSKLVSCGNVAAWLADNGNRVTEAMCYIFVT